MGWFSSIFGGANKTLDSGIDKVGSIGGFATNQGQKNLSTASTFDNSIVSGDQSKISKALAPEIGAIKSQVQQQKNQTTQFGTRSGGTNAAGQMMDDTARGQINGLVASLLNNSASRLMSSGEGLLSTGLGANMDQAQLSQVRMKNWEDSIFGRGLTTAAAVGEGVALGA